MPSRHLIDVEALLSPISPDKPAGEDLPYEIRLKLDEYRKTVEGAVHPADNKAGEWDKVLGLAQETLAGRSKHLRLAARLTEALVRKDHQDGVLGYAGLRDGLRLLRRLVEECWDRLQPPLEEEDALEIRAGDLNWLDEPFRGARFPISVQMVPLFGPKPQYSLFDMQFYPGGGGPISWNTFFADQSEFEEAARWWTFVLTNEGEITGPSSRWEFEEVIRTTKPAVLGLVMEDMAECFTELKILIRIAAQKMGRGAPRLPRLLRSVEICLDLLKRILDIKRALTERDTRFVEAPVPYIVGRPVQGDLFVGRKDVLKTLQNNLTPEAGKNILVLRGQRRTGKTSVLLRLRDILARKSYGFYLPIFVDVQGLTLVQNEGQFLYLLAHHIWSGLKSHDVAVSKPAAQEFDEAPLIAFELAFLENIKSALGHRQILLMLDEFEMLKGLIEGGQISEKILDYFRHLMQHSPLLFLIAGTQKLRELTGGYWSVFFNLAVYIDMGTLEESAAQWLITEPVRPWFTLEPAAVQEIVRVAGCHPYFTQLLCKKLLEVRNEQKLNRVGLAQVRLAVDRTLESGDDQIGYPWTEEDCSSAERLVLSALAGGLWETGTAQTRDDLKLRLQNAGALETAFGPIIDRLRLRGVVSENQERNLAFVVPLFQIWLVRKTYGTLDAARQYNREHAPA
jgi:hypothetical protein